MTGGQREGKELLKRKIYIYKFNELLIFGLFFAERCYKLIHRLGIEPPAVGAADLGMLSLSLDGIKGCQIGSGVTHLEHVWGLLWGKDVSYTPAPSSPQPLHGSNTISPPHTKP